MALSPASFWSLVGVGLVAVGATLGIGWAVLTPDGSARRAAPAPPPPVSATQPDQSQPTDAASLAAAQPATPATAPATAPAKPARKARKPAAPKPSPTPPAPAQATQRRLTHNQTIGLALYSFYSQDPAAGPIQPDPTAQLDPGELSTLRKLANASGLPAGAAGLAGNGTGLILALGRIGHEQEVILVRKALQRYQDLPLTDDPQERCRLYAWVQALAFLAARNIPGARDTLFELAVPEGWTALRICPSIVTDIANPTDEDVALEMSRRTIAAAVYARITAMDGCIASALETRERSHGVDNKFAHNFRNSIYPPVSRTAEVVVDPDEARRYALLLQQLDDLARRHADLVKGALTDGAPATQPSPTTRPAPGISG